MAQAPEQAKLMTLDELLTLGDARIEIINGEVAEKPMAAAMQNFIGRNLNRIIDTHVIATGIGEVFYDGFTYLMFSSSRGLKDSFVPDISFIRRENIITDWDITRFYPGVPDLAVEIISPSDSAYDIQKKLKTYLEKGTEQVWHIFPDTQELYQYRHDNNPDIRIYRASRPETIDVEALFPYLVLTTDDIFKLPAWAQQ
jgi:Uma2 family endonuclease